MKRIIWHWTAGAYGVNGLEKEHYHFIIDRDGSVVSGRRNPEANRSTKDGDYSAHTRGLNTGSIGVAIDAMAGARERPFKAGPAPITNDQVEALIDLTADLCETYKIKVTPRTVLSHAEVEETLGVWQKDKWDITWLPGMARPIPARQVGDELRRRVSEEIAKRKRPSKKSFWYWLRKIRW